MLYTAYNQQVCKIYTFDILNREKCFWWPSKH